MNIDNISVSLIYYEKAMKKCKNDKYKKFVNKYRALALAKFHDVTAIEILNYKKDSFKVSKCSF